MAVCKSIIILCVILGLENVELKSDFKQLRKKLAFEIKEKDLIAVKSTIHEAWSEYINITYFLNTEDTNEYSDWSLPLHQATFENNSNIVGFLVEKGADFDKLVISVERMFQYYTPLEIAAEQNVIEVAHFLLEKGAYLTTSKTQNIDGFESAPLHLAAKSNNTEMVDLILKYRGEVDVENTIGYTPLYYAAEKGNWEIVLILLNAGANVNVVHKRFHQNALHVAAEAKRNAKILINILIEAGADIELIDYFKRTPLHHAIKNGKFEAAKALIEHGAYLDSSYLKKHLDHTPLYSAVCAGDVKVVEIFLKAGANVTIGSGDMDYTILHAVAFLSKDIEPMAKLLLDFNADLKQKSKDGKTPLDLAIEQRNRIAVKVLKKLGA